MNSHGSLALDSDGGCLWAWLDCDLLVGNAMVLETLAMMLLHIL